MNKKIVTTFFAALFALSIFAVIPSITSERVKTIKIGIVLSTPIGYEEMVPVFEEIVEPDINEYCAKLPRGRFVPRRRFEFLFTDAGGTPEGHLQRVQEFHEMGVDLIIGGFWSSLAAGSLDYVNENDMLLISPGSTAPALAIPGDNLFRLRPDDTIQGRIIAKMMQTKDITNAIVFYRDDTWGNGLYEAFDVEYSALGGSILGAFMYEPRETDFTAYLSDANELAENVDDVGVLLICFLNERIDIITQASGGSYPNIYKPPWFGTEGAGRSPTTLIEAPDQAVYLRIFSALSAAPQSPKFMDFCERMETLLGYTPGFGWACDFDAAWLIAQAVLETRPTVIDDDDYDDDYDYFDYDFYDDDDRYRDAPAVIRVLPDIASRHYGYSGYCLLNEAGDRAAGTFDIWGFYLDDGTPSSKKHGSYNSATDELIWYD